MKLGNLRSITLEDMPDYAVKLMSASGIKKNLSDSTLFRYGFYNISAHITNKPMMAVKDLRKMSEASGVAKDGCKLRIDSTCKVPVTLLKPRYKIITSRSSQTPDLMVIGHVETPDYAFRMFVSDKLKVVLCVQEWNFAEQNSPDAPDLQDYQKFFGNAIDEWCNEYQSFYPYSGNLFDKFTLMPYSKGMYDFQNRVLPDTAFTSEERLITGTKPVTSDMIVSCMNMLNSSDKELRETALISLASSDYSKCRNVIAYLLSRYHIDDVKALKSKSTAVKWMANICHIERWGNYRFTAEETEIIKDYLERTSNGSLTFNDPSRTEIHCIDVSCLTKNHNLIKNTPGLSYDLPTANLVINNL